MSLVIEWDEVLTLNFNFADLARTSKNEHLALSRCLSKLGYWHAPDLSRVSQFGESRSSRPSAALMTW